MQIRIRDSDWVQIRKIIVLHPNGNTYCKHTVFTYLLFMQSNLHFKSFTKLSAELLDDIIQLETKIFPKPYSKEVLEREMNSKNSLFGILVYDGDRSVAYKIGFAHSVTIFYSWIGGVHPEYRCKGVARELIHLQHKWCKNTGFEKVRTSSENEFREMMILNLREGFDIIGTYISGRASGPTIMFEKNLKA